MRTSRYPFGKVLPEIRDLILASPSAIEALEEAAKHQADLSADLPPHVASAITQTKIDAIFENHDWLIKVSFATGARRIMAFSQDKAVVITDNIVRVAGAFPETVVASLAGKPLRTLVETGFAQADAGIIQSVIKSQANAAEPYLVVTIKIRTVILPRQRPAIRQARSIQGSK